MITVPAYLITLGLIALVLLALGLPVCLALGLAAGSLFTHRASLGQNPLPSLSEIKATVFNRKYTPPPEIDDELPKRKPLPHLGL